MKTLYVFDIDGTVMPPQGNLSETAVSVFKKLAEKNVLFSVATARAPVTAMPIMKILGVTHPAVLMEGVLIFNPVTEKIIKMERLDSGDAFRIINILLENNEEPLLFTCDSDENHIVYYRKEHLDLKNSFSRKKIEKGDKRFKCINSFDEISYENCIYIRCDVKKERICFLLEKLSPFNVTANYYYDSYTDAYSFSIGNKFATKGDGVKKLKSFLSADELVVFGDGHNDMSMFEKSDRAYAMEESPIELKNMATGILGSVYDDSAVKFVLNEINKI